MAILDTEYVKAPSLRAGDLSITKSSTGFSMSEGDTVFLTGSAGGTLTIGKENLTSSIPTLRINAREVYWNNRPLEDYWAEGGGSGPGGPDLTQEVTELQELTAANTQAIQATDERLSDLRLDALGAKINILVSPINNYVSNICGVAVPATSLKEALPYFNKITLNNVQNSGTGYLAIYSCDVTTPAIDSECTLLYVSEEAFETTGAPTTPTSSIINIPEKINVPDSGLILLIFSSSATSPQANNISWVTGENSTMVIRLGIYSPGATNRPYDTKGVYVLQKVTNAAFLTYSPDIDFSYVYDETESILSEDIEDIKSQIVDLESAVEDLQSDVEDRMTYEETVEVVVSQIEELKSDLGGGMTYEETMEAIASFPDDNNTDRLYNLGSLVDALTTNQPLTLVKKVSDDKSSIEFNEKAFRLVNADYRQNGTGTNGYSAIAELKLGTGIAHLMAIEADPHTSYPYYPSVIMELSLGSGIAHLAASRHDLSGGSVYYTAITELKLESGIAHLATRQHAPSIGESVDLTSLSMRNTGSLGSEAGIIDLKSICKSSLTGTEAQSITYLTAGQGKLELGIQDNGQDLFQLSAKYQDGLYTDGSISAVQLIAKSRIDSEVYSQLDMDAPSFNLRSVYKSDLTGTGIPALTYLSTGPGRLGLGIQNNGRNLFQLSADYSKARLTSTSAQNSTIYSELYMTSGACDIRSHYSSMLTGTIAQASTYLTTGSGTMAMGIQDNGLDLFKLSASVNGTRLKHTKYNDSEVYSELDTDPSGINMLVIDGSASSEIISNKFSVTQDGISFTTYNPTIWNTKLGTSSKFVPTISIVHHLIQQALANQ